MPNSAPDTGQRGWGHHGLEQQRSAQRTKGGARPHPSRTQVYMKDTWFTSLPTVLSQAEML